MKQKAYIALGSNIGDSAETLLQALILLARRPGIEVRRVSQFHKTEPVGGPPEQPKFFNAVAEIETSFPPRELLRVLQEVEKALGRDRASEERWGPRTCDLDILLMDQTVLESPNLTIPHPRMHERRFVLEPLASIAPKAVHPVLRKTIAELLEAIQ